MQRATGRLLSSSAIAISSDFNRNYRRNPSTDGTCAEESESVQDALMRELSLRNSRSVSPKQKSIISPNDKTTRVSTPPSRLRNSIDMDAEPIEAVDEFKRRASTGRAGSGGIQPFGRLGSASSNKSESISSVIQSDALIFGLPAEDALFRRLSSTNLLVVSTGESAALCRRVSSTNSVESVTRTLSGGVYEITNDDFCGVQEITSDEVAQFENVIARIENNQHVTRASSGGGVFEIHMDDEDDVEVTDGGSFCNTGGVRRTASALEISDLHIAEGLASPHSVCEDHVMNEAYWEYDSGDGRSGARQTSGTSFTRTSSCQHLRSSDGDWYGEGEEPSDLHAVRQKFRNVGYNGSFGRTTVKKKM